MLKTLFGSLVVFAIAFANRHAQGPKPQPPRPRMRREPKPVQYARLGPIEILEDRLL